MLGVSGEGGPWEGSQGLGHAQCRVCKHEPWDSAKSQRRLWDGTKAAAHRACNTLVMAALKPALA